MSEQPHFTQIRKRTALLCRPIVGWQASLVRMATNILTKIFGSRNDRLLKQYRTVVNRITAMEPQFEQLSDEDLRAKTREFKERVA